MEHYLSKTFLMLFTKLNLVFSLDFHTQQKKTLFEHILFFLMTEKHVKPLSFQNVWIRYPIRLDHPPEYHGFTRLNNDEIRHLFSLSIEPLVDDSSFDFIILCRHRIYYNNPINIIISL